MVVQERSWESLIVPDRHRCGEGEASMIPKRVAVIGSGYVGTVVAACLASVGHQIVGVESDRRRLSLLSVGTVPFHEPGLGEILFKTLAQGRLRFTDDFADAMNNSDVVFVCVGTPPGPDRHPDMGAMVLVSRSIAETLAHPPRVRDEEHRTHWYWQLAWIDDRGHRRQRPPIGNVQRGIQS